MRFTLRSVQSLALGAAVLGTASLVGCNKLGSAKFSKTKSGIEYKIFKKVGSKYELREIGPDGDPTYKDRVGKFLTAHIQTSTGKDSVMDNTRKQFDNTRVPLQLGEVQRKGGPEEAYALLQPGDSAVFRFALDSLFKGRPAPPALKRGGSFVQLFVSTDKLIERPEAEKLQQSLQIKAIAAQQKEVAAYATTQGAKDDVIIQDYMKKNGLKMQKDASGIYYQILKPGTGPNVAAGQRVSMNYAGMLLSGKEFDSSAKHGGQPFEFTLGRGEVIPGWDKGVALLNKGSRAIFLIPAPLAYGKAGAGADIPADSPLKFDVEVLDIKAAAPAPAPMPMPAMPTAPAGAPAQ